MKAASSAFYIPTLQTRSPTTCTRQSGMSRSPTRRSIRFRREFDDVHEKICGFAFRNHPYAVDLRRRARGVFQGRTERTAGSSTEFQFHLSRGYSDLESVGEEVRSVDSAAARRRVPAGARSEDRDAGAF